MATMTAEELKAFEAGHKANWDKMSHEDLLEEMWELLDEKIPELEEQIAELQDKVEALKKGKPVAEEVDFP